MSTGGHGQREGEPEGRALLNVALDVALSLPLARNTYLSAMGLDDRLADVQAQAQPAPRPALHADALGSVERLPDAVVLAARQPRSMVRDSDARHGSRLGHSDGDRLVLWRIFE